MLRFFLFTPQQQEGWPGCSLSILSSLPVKREFGEMVLKSLNTVDQTEEEKKSPGPVEDHIPPSDVPLSGSTGQNWGRGRERTLIDSTSQATEREKNRYILFFLLFVYFFFHVLCSALFWFVTGSLLSGHSLLSHMPTSFLPTSPSILLPSLPPPISLGIQPQNLANHSKHHHPCACLPHPLPKTRHILLICTMVFNAWVPLPP